MKGHMPRLLRSHILVPTTAATLILAVAATGLVAQEAQPQVSTKTFTNDTYHYTVALPEGCRQEEGPGTLDAICAPDMSPERSARANSTSALVMQVSAQIVQEDAGHTAGDIARTFDEKAFREELPQAVCGESDPARARIENVKQVIEDSRVVYTADVICAEVSFLQIAERRASVRYIFGPMGRYRVVTRAPIEDFERNKQAIGAFFDSFRVQPPGSKSQ